MGHGRVASGQYLPLHSPAVGRLPGCLQPLVVTVEAFWQRLRRRGRSEVSKGRGAQLLRTVARWTPGMALRGGVRLSFFIESVGYHRPRAPGRIVFPLREAEGLGDCRLSAAVVEPPWRLLYRDITDRFCPHGNPDYRSDPGCVTAKEKKRDGLKGQRAAKSQLVLETLERGQTQ